MVHTLIESTATIEVVTQAGTVSWVTDTLPVVQPGSVKETCP